MLYNNKIIEDEEAEEGKEEKIVVEEKERSGERLGREGGVKGRGERRENRG